MTGNSAGLGIREASISFGSRLLENDFIEFFVDFRVYDDADSFEIQLCQSGGGLCFAGRGPVGADGACRYRGAVEGLALWSPSSPVRHTFTISTFRAGVRDDFVSFKVGFATPGRHDGQFLMNGVAFRPVMVSIDSDADGSSLGRRLTLLRGLGVNLICPGSQLERNYEKKKDLLAELCDERGMLLVSDEAPGRHPCRVPKVFCEDLECVSDKDLLDPAGLPGKRYYEFLCRFTGKKGLHLLPHWSFTEKPGTPVDITAYSNFPRIALYVNDKFVTEGTHGEDEWHVDFKDLPYQPGRLVAVAFDAEGKEQARTTAITAGPPKAVRLVPEPKYWRVEGGRICFVRTYISDRSGQTCPLATDEINFEVSENATLLSLETSHTVVSGDGTIRAEGGTCVAKIFVRGDTRADVSAWGPGLSVDKRTLNPPAYSV